MNNKVLIGAVCVIGIIWLLSHFSGQFSGGYEELTPNDRLFIRQQSLRELHPTIREIDRRLQYAIAYNDQRAIAKYSPMAYRLAAIRQRLDTPRSLFAKYDARDDLAEIREIRATLAKGR